MAALVDVYPSQVVFTSGGTEANNCALKGVAAKVSPGRIAISAIEHSSLLGAAQALIAHGWQCDSIAVDERCRVSLAALLAQQELASRTAHLQTVRDALEQRLRALPGIVAFAAQAQRVANTVLYRRAGHRGRNAVDGAGSSRHRRLQWFGLRQWQPRSQPCVAGDGVDPDLARRVIRISLGKDNTLADIDRLIAILNEQVSRAQVNTWG